MDASLLSLCIDCAGPAVVFTKMSLTMNDNGTVVYASVWFWQPDISSRGITHYCCVCREPEVTYDRSTASVSWSPHVTVGSK